MTYGELCANVGEREREEGGYGRRIVRVTHPAPASDLWIGEFGSATVEVGEAGYQYSDGEVVLL